MMNTKNILLTGLQPSGNLTIGNYFGAIKNCVELQNEYKCLLMLPDLHSLTVQNDADELRRRCYSIIALYLACGIDPDKSSIFVQSHVPGHSQLACILNNFTGMGELQRMTQYKDKALRHKENLNSGLFFYPVLMAADILLYGTALVPIGDDQKQHLELTRNVALKFNKRFGEVLTVPEAFVPETGARIMSLQNASAKMSKTDMNPDNSIFLIDSPETIAKKMKKAVTDSGNVIHFNSETKPGISNLLTIYSCITDKSIKEIEEKYSKKGYGHLKIDLADLIIEFLRPIQVKYRAIINDERYLSDILLSGVEFARKHAEQMIKRINEILGLIPLKIE